MAYLDPSRSIEKAASIAFRPFMDLPQLRRVYLEDYRDSQGLIPTLESYTSGKAGGLKM